MLVERVKEPESDLEVSALSDGGVLRNRKVHVLRVRTSQVGDPRSHARVSEGSRTGWACARWFEASERLECRRVEKRTFARIVAIRVLEEGIHAVDCTHQAVLAELRHHFARGRARAEPHRGSFGPVDEGTNLPATHQRIGGAAMICILLAFPKRQVVYESGRENLRNVIGRKRPGAALLKRRDHALCGIPGAAQLL